MLPTIPNKMYTKTFECSDFAFNRYVTSNDRTRASRINYHEFFKLIGIEQNFQSRDWFGGYTDCTGRIVRVEIGEYGDIYITIKVTGLRNPNYGPDPSDILREKGVWFPISYRELNN